MSENQSLNQAPATLDVPSDAEIEWTKATSKNGVEYEYGVKKSNLGKLAESAIAGAKDGATALGANNHIDVDWRVQNDDEWQQTSSDFANQVGISSYMVRPTSSFMVFYTHRLDVTVVRCQTWYFRDRSGDVYALEAFLSGEHYVRYRSSNPDIDRVTY
ncbi:hypothetical protein GGG16DRAFT_110262 [Schizophyllum commune]